MKRYTPLIVLLVFWLGSITWATEKANKKVDYSGTWILDKSKTDRAPTMQSGGGGSSGRGGIGRGGRYPGGRSGGGRTGGGRGDNLPGGANLLRVSMIVIEQTENELRVAHKTDDAGEGYAGFKQVFMLDGGESVNPGFPAGGEMRSRTSWDKEKLVTLGTQKASGANIASEIVVKQEFSLSKNGKTLTLKTTQSSARGGFTFKQVFVKQTDKPK
jgi:hypothetical protein